MASFVYHKAMAVFCAQESGKSIDWDASSDGVIQILLTKADAQTSANDTEGADRKYVGEITTLGENGGSGYVRKDLPNRSLTLAGDASNQQEFDSDDVLWTSLVSDGTANAIAGGVVHQVSGSDGVNELICWVDLGDVVVNGVDFTIQFATEGVFKTVAQSAP